MLKFYNLPLLSAGGLTFDFSKNKTKEEDEFHLLVKTGYDWQPLVETITDRFRK